MSVALELEHSLGFSLGLQGITCHPAQDKCTVAYGCGKLLIISDLDDCHEQRLLRGHDANITCVDISSSGSMLCSGQVASLDSHVYFQIWNFDEGTVKLKIQTPHKGKIEAIRFSPDEAMIATTGAEGSLCIWDAISGKKVTSYQDTINGDEARAIFWGEVQNSGTRHQRYWLYVPFNTGVRLCTLSFSIQRLMYELECTPCHLPGGGGRMGGYLRKYNCLTGIGKDLLCGTSSGDLLVFNAETGNYRTAITLCANGTNAIVSVPGESSVFIGGGDGKVKKVSGQDQNWKLYGEITLEGSVVSMASTSDGAQLIVMTSAGLIYRVLTVDMTFSIAAEAPLRGLTDVVVANPDQPEVFATCSNDGLIRVWDLNDYSIKSSFSLATRARAGGSTDVPIPTCCAFDPKPNVLLCGWSDGRIRAVNVSKPHGELLYTMNNGHKGTIHTMRVCGMYFVTGGEDTVIRVWSRETQELVAQLQDHKLPTTGAVIDNTSHSILHTVGLDMFHCAFDLSLVDSHPNTKGPKCITAHSHPGCGGFTCLTQRTDNEHEIIVGTVDGHILFFDLDVPQKAVLVVADKNKVRVVDLKVSPDGRHLVAGLADGSLVLYALGAEKMGAGVANRCDPLLHAVCHSASVVKCQWTCDGRQLITAGHDGELIVWNFYEMNN